MHGGLSDQAQLLSAWEAAAALPGVARGAALVERAGLAEDFDAALDLPVGAVAALAARLHADTFGDLVDGVVTCAACSATLDVPLSLGALPAAHGDTTRVIAPGGRELRVRAPTTRDLLAARELPDPARALVGACVSDATGAATDADDLGDDVLTVVDDAAEALAGAAAITVRATCPDCGAAVVAPLDVGALLWDRVTRAVAAALREVAELAAALGWSEADVLALSPLRRQAYLEIVREPA